MRASHRRCREALQNFSRARDHNGESQSPQSAAHQVHSNQTGNQKIYITSTWFSHRLFANFHDVCSSLTTLQNIVDDEPGSTTLRPGWIETIFEGVVFRSNNNRHLAASQSLY